MARLVACQIGAAALLLCGPASAADAPRHPRSRPLLIQQRPIRPSAAPLDVAVAPGVAFRTPFTVVAGDPGRVLRVPHYIGPDGTYDERADLVRSIEGTPCGEACTRRALVRWGYAPVE